MTLTTSPQPMIRSYSIQTPKWQRFQAPLVSASSASASNNTTSGSSSSNKHGKIVSTSSIQTIDSSNNSNDHPYMRQYSHVYHQRLALLGPKCWDTINNDTSIQLIDNTTTEENNQNAVIRVDRILELREKMTCVAVGTLVKETLLVTDSNNKQLHPQSVCRTNDQLYLEDESGRVAIEIVSKNNNTKHQYCSGIVVGMMGYVGIDGVMNVEKVYYPSSSPLSSGTTDVACQQQQENQMDPYLLLISGLNCGSCEKSSLSLEMLVSFLQGSYSGTISKAAKVSHIICAGGLIETTIENNNETTDPIGNGNTNVSSTVHGCRELDGFCYTMIQNTGIPLTILPGQNDPTTANWPQRPIHRSLLPMISSSNKKLMNAVPNPYAATFQCNDSNHTLQQYVIGTDGRNVQDLTKRLLKVVATKKGNQGEEPGDNSDNTNENDVDDNDDIVYEPISELDALELTLKWKHICPTGPETVPTVPHGPTNPDPMVLRDDTVPSIYFCGNSTQFATKLVRNVNDAAPTTRLICVPKFAETGEAVLVNIKTLQVELLRFLDD